MNSLDLFLFAEERYLEIQNSVLFYHIYAQQVLVELMKIFLPILPEELLKAFVTEVCKNRMEDQGYNGEIICRQTVENFARHVS